MGQTEKWDKFLIRFKPVIDKAAQAVKNIVQSDVDLARESFSYLFKVSGKNIRFLLTVLSASLFTDNKIRDDYIDFGLSCELLHLASLVHDDIIDNSHERRSQESLNARYGNTLSLLVGDFLFVSALKKGVEKGSLEVNDILLTTTKIMVEGELLQLQNKKNLELTQTGYLNIIEKKTALFFANCCRIGGLLGGANEENLELLKKFGYNLGMAFQLIDDSLDLNPAAGDIGKPNRQDLVEGCITWPLIYLRDNVSGAQKDELVRMLGDWQEERDFPRLCELMDEYQVMEKLQEFAREYSARARASLVLLKETGDTFDLHTLTDLLLHRSY